MVGLERLKRLASECELARRRNRDLGGGDDAASDRSKKRRKFDIIKDVISSSPSSSSLALAAFQKKREFMDELVQVRQRLCNARLLGSERTSKKMKRNWHVRFTEMSKLVSMGKSGLEGKEVLILVTALGPESLRQSSSDSVEVIEENLSLYLECCSRLANLMETGELFARLAPLFKEIVLCNFKLNRNEYQAQITQIAVNFSRGFRTACLNPQDRRSIYDLAEVLYDVFAEVPTIFRNGVGQLDQGCSDILRSTNDEVLRNACARLLAITSSSYGGNMFTALEGFYSACFHSCQLILKRLFPRVSERKVETTVLNHHNADESKTYYPGLKSLILENGELSGIELQRNFVGFCACLEQSLACGFPEKHLVELAFHNWMQLFFSGLDCASCSSSPCFPEIAKATLKVLKQVADTVPIALLRHRTVLCKLLSRMLALPKEEFPVHLHCEVLRTCQALCLALGIGLGKTDFIDFWFEHCISTLESEPEMLQDILNFTCTLLYSNGSLVKASLRDKLDSKLISILPSMSVSAPQLHITCLEALLASSLNPSKGFRSSSAMPLALNEFSRACSNPSLQVRQFAHRASAACQALVHPSRPCIGAPEQLIVYEARNEEKEEEDLVFNTKTLVEKKATVEDHKSSAEEMKNASDDSGAATAQKFELQTSSSSIVEKISTGATANHESSAGEQENDDGHESNGGFVRAGKKLELETSTSSSEGSELPEINLY